MQYWLLEESAEHAANKFLCCAVLVAMGVAVAFSGVMFSRLGTLLPGARSFDDLGAAAFGRRGRILAFCTVNVAIFAAPALLHLTCAESLQQIFAHQGLTHTQAILIIAAVIIPLTQASPAHPVLVLVLLAWPPKHHVVWMLANL